MAVRALVLATLASAVLARPALAVTKTWVGGTAGNIWSNTANWSPSGLPAAADDVVLTSTNNVAMVIDQNVYIKSFTINASHTASISHTTALAGSAYYMVITGDFTMNGNCTFTMPLERMTIGGKFTKTAGTFTHSNSGTLFLTAATSQSHTFGDASFHDLVISNAAPVTSGLVGHWKLDNALTDSGSSGTTLTSTGGSFSAYPYTAPTLFSNTHSGNFTSDDYFGGTVPAAMNTNTWSLAAWIRMDNSDASTSCSEVVSIGNNYLLRVCGVANSAGTVSTHLRKNADNTYAICAGTRTIVISDDRWHHIASTNDGTRLRVYVDGYKTDCSPHSATTDYDGTAIRIGAHPTNSTYDYDGRIDDVRVYNRALTDLEVLTLAAGGAGVSGTVTHTGGGAFTVANDLRLGGGTVAGNSAISLKGSYYNLGATLTWTGTVSLTGNASGKTILSSGQPFAALTVNGAGGVWTLSDALTVSGVLTLTSGELNASSYNITAANMAGSGTFTPGTGTVTLNGATAATIGPSSFNALTLASATASTTTEDANLVTLWKFEEGSGTTAADSSANAMTGTLANVSGTGTPAWTSDVKPLSYMTNTRALSFNAGASSNNQMVRTTFTAMPTSITLAAWINQKAAGDSFPRIVNLPYFRMYVSRTSNELGAYCDRATGPDGNWKTATGVVGVDNGWHHIAVTYNASNLSGDPILYYDGSPVAIASGSGLVQETTSFNRPDPNLYLTVGDDHLGGASFQGFIDDVRVYDRILTGAEIATLYSGGTVGITTYDPGATFSVGAASTTIGGALTVTFGTLAVPTGKSLIANGAVTISDFLSIAGGGSMTTGASAVSVAKPLTVGGSLTTGGGAVTFSDTVSVGAAGSLTTGSGTVTLNKALTVDGTYTIGNGRTLSNTSDAHVTINGTGSLKMNTLQGSLRMKADTTLKVDGTLQSTTGTNVNQPVIDTASGTFAFKVGSTGSATPTLSLNGLSVQNTDTDGMYINAVAGANTTLSRFDNVKFLGTTSGGGKVTLLQVAGSAATPLSLIGDGIVFDSTNTTFNIKLVDRDGDGNNVRAELTATCTATGKTVCENYDQDADTNNDNSPDDTVGAAAGTTLNSLSSTGGAVALDGPIVTFSGAKPFSLNGTVVGHPVVSFGWSNFVYRATYVAYNNGSDGKDRLYKLNASGVQVGAAWELSGSEDIVGQPRWVESGGVWHVFVLSSNGTVYKLLDKADNTGFSQVWAYRNDATNSTATSPLAVDFSNLYWVGNGAAGTPKIFSLKQTATPSDTQGNIDASGLNGSGDVVAGTGAPTVNLGTGSQVYFASAGNIYRYAVSGWLPNSVQPQQTPPSDHAVSAVHGRVSVMENVIYFVDDTGRLFARNSDLSALWSYQGLAHHASCPAGGACQAKNLFVNRLQGYIYYGDKDGHVYAVKRSGTSNAGTLVDGFPLYTGSTANSFEVMPHYRSGVIAIGATNGRLFFIDQRNASNAPALIRTYQLNASVSAITFDSTTSRYLVATGDGRFYYIPVINDPTSGFN